MSNPNATIDPVAMQAVAVHQECTALRAAAYKELFDNHPASFYAFHQLRGKDDGPFLIDVFIYPLVVQGVNQNIFAAVTNGMSDQPMAHDTERPESPRRRELIQYLPACPQGRAQRLRDMAWLPLFDGFLLDSRDTIAWQLPPRDDTPWTHGFFLEPVWQPHQGPIRSPRSDEIKFICSGISPSPMPNCSSSACKAPTSF